MTPELVALEGQIVSALIGFAATAVVAGIGYASIKLQAIARAKGDEALATMEATATAKLQPALQTSASVIAGKIASGELPLNDRAAWVAEAQREAALVALRVPGAIATLQASTPTLIASIMGKVDQAVVASPTIPSTTTEISAPPKRAA